jgi:hypothetical protein
MINIERGTQHGKKVCGGKVAIILDIPDISSKRRCVVRFGALAVLILENSFHYQVDRKPGWPQT